MINKFIRLMGCVVIGLVLTLILAPPLIYITGRCVKTVHFDTLDNPVLGAKGSYCAQREFFTWERG